MIERLIYNGMIGMAIPVLAQFLDSRRASPDWLWIVLAGAAYALFLESYRIWMQSLQRGQTGITIASVFILTVVVFSHLTFEGLVMLIALSLSMISLFRSTKKYTQALDHFKQQLQEDHDDQ